MFRLLKFLKRQFGGWIYINKFSGCFWSMPFEPILNLYWPIRFINYHKIVPVRTTGKQQYRNDCYEQENSSTHRFSLIQEKPANVALQLRRAKESKLEGAQLLEEHAIAPSAASACSARFRNQ